MLASLLIVAVLGAALAKDVVNLRGAIGEGHGLPYGQKEVDVKEGEAALAEFIKSIKESEFATNLANGNLLSRTDKDVQNYLGGRSPSLTYQGHITAKKFDNLDCSGQATSIAAVAFPCVRMGGQSMTTICAKENGTLTLSVAAFSNRNCTGEPVMTQSMGELGCEQRFGAVTGCVLSEKPPKFTKREGLVTYKFRSTDACQNFASYYLNFYAPVNDELAQGDDLLTLPYYGYGGDDGYGGVGGEGYGGGTDEGSFGGLEAAEAADTHDRAGHHQHHQHQQHRQEVGHGIHHRTTQPGPAAEAATTNTALASESPHPPRHDLPAPTEKMHLAFIGGDGEPPKREFAYTHLFNDVCAFDKKYGLWVKTSCHGRAGKLSHYIFADAECRRPIKRVLHDLSTVVPHYGTCAKTYSKAPEVLLTVCHNDIDAPVEEPRL